MTAGAPDANVIVNVLRLLTFGSLGIEAEDGSASPRLRPPRLALLAVLAAAGDRGVSRERLAALFWPDSDDAHARQSLRQTLYGLRADLGREVVRSTGSTLALDEATISADVIEFRSALAAGDRARAVGLARGPFLDGFYLPGAPAFERWMEEERARLMSVATSALVALATEAARTHQHDAAAEWWRHLTVIDPVSGRYALGYLKALAARGDRAEALAFARQHETVVRRELEADPDPEVRRLEAELRALPSPDVSRPVPPAPPALAPPHLAMPDVALPNVTGPPARRRFARSALTMAGVGAAVLLVVTALVARQRGWFRGAVPPATFAVGLIRDEGAPDAQHAARVLTDMIATNLARVQGLTMLANSRLLELMRPDQDSAAGYSDAARRAGATELLEGQLMSDARSRLTLEMRRVEIRTGIVREVYRVTAADRPALVDSLTQVIARRFGLALPPGSIADVTTASATAYRFYAEGLRAYFQNDLKASQRLMHAALAEDSTIAMGWYFVDKLLWMLGDSTFEGRTGEPRRRALQYASRLPERERLTIRADLLGQNYDLSALAVAESLTAKYPADPHAHMVLGSVRMVAGDWLGAAAATERAVAIDSATEAVTATTCQLCEDLSQLGQVYLWWDSLSAVKRTAERYRAMRPQSSQPFFLLGIAAQRLGDSAAAYANFRQLTAHRGADFGYKSQVDLALEEYDQAERQVRQLLGSSFPEEWDFAAWKYVILLRNEGRLREAEQLNRTGMLPGLSPPVIKRTPGIYNEGILLLAEGHGREAASVFRRLRSPDMSQDPPGFRARVRAWSGTLEGMALAAAGDTLAVLALADSVEAWGHESAYGRDRRAHHYLRGLVLAAGGNHEDAVRELRAAIHSPSLGFTRVNYELARSLLQLERPHEAVAALQPALRGELDASNLYITHTELHELLAQAFDAAGVSDSAAFHYRAVVKGWRRSDPSFWPRRDAAQSWLARHQRVATEFR